MARPGGMQAIRWLVGASLLVIVAACQAGPSSTPVGSTPVGSTPSTAQPESSTSPASSASPAASPASSASPSAKTAPSAAPAADTIVLTVDVVGGECPNGPCGAQFVVYGDGRVDGPPGAIQAIPVDQMTLISDQVGRTDWDAVRAVPFTGECPTAFDGQKHIYSFPARGGDLVFDSCEFDLSAAPLFQSIDAALFAGG